MDRFRNRVKGGPKTEWSPNVVLMRVEATVEIKQQEIGIMEGRAFHEDVSEVGVCEDERSGWEEGVSGLAG